jgi:thiol-disulfide isomerase/thioredoxin
MRAIEIALLPMALCAVGCLGLLTAACAMSAAGVLPPELVAAQESLNQNLALGKSLAGQKVTPEQAAQADKLAQEGVIKALDYAKAQPRSADAHHLAGMLAVFAYRSVESKVSITGSKTGEVSSETLIALHQFPPQLRDQGLAELRTAIKLAPANIDFQTDYAEATQMYDDTARSADLLNALWQRQNTMSGAQQARIARLGVQAAQAQKDTIGEARWLREVVKRDPTDEAAKTRLAALIPSTGITWQSYEDGLTAAAAEGKPVMIDFMADWCGWCKKLDAEVYSQKAVIDLGKQFVWVQVNGGMRRDLVRKYGVDGFPTILFLNARGQEIHRVVGFEPAAKFLNDMQTALSRQ